MENPAPTTAAVDDAPALYSIEGLLAERNHYRAQWAEEARIRADDAARHAAEVNKLVLAVGEHITVRSEQRARIKDLESEVEQLLTLVEELTAATNAVTDRAGELHAALSPTDKPATERAEPDPIVEIECHLDEVETHLSDAAFILTKAQGTARKPRAEPDVPEELRFDFRAHLARQREWSGKTFGPGPRTQGVIDHIRKELGEIEADPSDIAEWIDVVILALDGAWRAGYSPDQIIAALAGKQAKNEARDWPDWRTSDPNKAIEHVRIGGRHD